VNAVFVIAGVVHDKAIINPEQCDIGALMNLALRLDSALPWSKTGKYQRIKQYKVNKLSGSMITWKDSITHYFFKKWDKRVSSIFNLVYSCIIRARLGCVLVIVLRTLLSILINMFSKNEERKQMLLIPFTF
jgi:hypothetical protein